jgi:ribosome biogenesis GTPase A
MREQWFPGHMAKAKKTVKDNLQNVDVVIEVRDARVPDSTGNPDLAEILKGKPLVIALNKRDMADPEATEKWLQYFQKQGIPALAVNALQSHGIRELIALVRKAAEARFARMDARGRREQPVRIMIVGIPNVGKITADQCIEPACFGTHRRPTGGYPRKTVDSYRRAVYAFRYPRDSLATAT